MSVYYSFYIGKKDIEKDTFSITGPLINGELKPFYWRSRSFINGSVTEPFKAELLSKFDLNSIKALGFLSYDVENSEDIEEYETVYTLSFENAKKYLGTQGLKKGFVKIESYISFKEDNYSDYEILNECKIISPEIIAQMPVSEREKYVYVVDVDTRDLEYIVNIAFEMFDGWNDDSQTENGKYEFYIMCTVG